MEKQEPQVQRAKNEEEGKTQQVIYIQEMAKKNPKRTGLCGEEHHSHR